MGLIEVSSPLNEGSLGADGYHRRPPVHDRPPTSKSRSVDDGCAPNHHGTLARTQSREHDACEPGGSHQRCRRGEEHPPIVHIRQ